MQTAGVGCMMGLFSSPSQGERVDIKAIVLNGTLRHCGPMYRVIENVVTVLPKSVLEFTDARCDFNGYTGRLFRIGFTRTHAYLVVYP